MGKKRLQSPKEKQAKVEAAKKQQEAYEASKARAGRSKKILTIVVCALLILGMCVPTMALTVCKNTNTSTTTEQTEQTS